VLKAKRLVPKCRFRKAKKRTHPPTAPTGQKAQEKQGSLQRRSSKIAGKWGLPGDSLAHKQKVDPKGPESYRFKKADAGWNVPQAREHCGIMKNDQWRSLSQISLRS